jgi:hypothetical protein
MSSLGDIGWEEALAAVVLPGGLPVLAAYELSKPGAPSGKTIALVAAAGLGVGLGVLLVFRSLGGR